MDNNNKDNKGFVKNPLTEKEKELKAKKFLMGANPEPTPEDELTEEDTAKNKIHAIMLRVPMAHYKKLLKIKKATGLTMNGVCLDLLWSAMKQKLIDLGID